MLTTSEAGRLRSFVDAGLMNLEDLLPTAASNTGAVALRYWLWNWVSKQVQAKVKVADKEAIRVGALFDHKDKPLAPGTNLEIYRDDNVSIGVEVRQPSRRLDINRLKLLLINTGRISESELDEMIDAATNDTAPAHLFRSTLVEGNSGNESHKTVADTLY